MGKTFGIVVASLVLPLSLSGCVNEITNEVEDTSIVDVEQEEYLGATDDGSSIIVPIPSSEARVEFQGILKKSIERFITLGSTETFTNVEGEAEYTVIHDPTFEPGPAYVVVAPNPDDPDRFIADWSYTFESFAVVQANNLYAATDPPAVFNVTKVDANRYILADEIIGSRMVYVSGGLISGIDVLDGLGNLIGRTALTYGVTETEKGIIEQVYNSTSPEELTALFSANDSE